METLAAPSTANTSGLYDCNDTLRSSTEDELKKDLSKLQSNVLVISYLTLALAIILGNACVFAVFVRDARVRELPFNVYIFALSITDLSVGVFNLPYHALTVIWPGVEYANFYVSICVLYVGYVTAMTSVCLVILMSVDRLRLISNPTGYSHHCHRGSNVRIILRMLLFSCLYCLLLLALRGLLRKKDSSCFQNLPYLVSLLGGNILIPGCCLLSVNLMLVLKFHGHLKEVRGFSAVVKGDKANAREMSDIGRNAESNERGTWQAGNPGVSKEGIISRGQLPHNWHVDYSEDNAKIVETSFCTHALQHHVHTSVNTTSDNTATTSVLEFDKRHSFTESQFHSGTVTTLSSRVRKDPKDELPPKRIKSPGSGRLIKHMVIFVCIYLACWIPSHAYFTFKAVAGVDLYDSMDVLQHVFYIILYVNSALNPFLYAAMGMRFRSGVIELCFKQTSKPENRSSHVSTSQSLFNDLTGVN